MIFQTNTIALANLVTALCSLLVVMFCIYRKNNSGAMQLAALMFAITLWAICGMLEAAAVQLPDKILWSQLSYFGIVSTPVIWLIFAVRFARREHWFPIWARWGLWLFPVATLTVALTNPWHQLLWGEITPSRYPNVLVYTHNVWFWLHLGYSYLLMLAGTALLILGLQKSRHQRTVQSVLILLGALIPWAGNMIYASGLSPIPGLDITPLVLVFSGSLIAADILQFGLLDLVPLARDAVVERMPDGVIVIDEQDRVVDINPAARELFSGSGSDFIGRPVRSFFLVWSSLSERLKDASESHAEIQLGGATQRSLDVRASVLKNEKGRVIGRIAVLRDISARVQMETALLEMQTKIGQQKE